MKKIDVVKSKINNSKIREVKTTNYGRKEIRHEEEMIPIREEIKKKIEAAGGIVKFIEKAVGQREKKMNEIAKEMPKWELREEEFLKRVELSKLSKEEMEALVSESRKKSMSEKRPNLDEKRKENKNSKELYEEQKKSECILQDLACTMLEMDEDDKK